MSLSKFFNTTSSGRGGAKNNKSFVQKESEVLSESAVRSFLELPCDCDPECTFKLMNEVDNVVEFIMGIRRERFTGQLPVSF